MIWTKLSDEHYVSTARDCNSEPYELRLVRAQPNRWYLSTWGIIANRGISPEKAQSLALRYICYDKRSGLARSGSGE